MSGTQRFLAGLLLGFLFSVVVVVEAGTDRRYGGAEVEALRAAFNANATLVNTIKTDLNDVVSKLNADPGVGFTNYATVNTASTCDTLRR